MKTLVVEDDFTARVFLQEMLRAYGPCDAAENGREALSAVNAALEAREPYDVICLDVGMPEMDGQQSLSLIRALESQHGRGPGRGAKILMTTAMRDKENIMQAFREQCDGYLVKPLDMEKVLRTLAQFGLVTAK